MAARLSDAEKEKRRAFRDARAIVEQALKADVNEAETRRRIERIFENVMGYDPFVHLSRERAVRGAGDTEHVDFAVQLEERVVLMVAVASAFFQSRARATSSAARQSCCASFGN